ncbi:ferredoxin [Pseudonocardia pini]|uniref:ferredoxin n=1 Tax=Pseudonocardia pini TaxID=2758030 RepID=UPI0015F0670F|nr:ferredoxin [Pseudonocardia pini]
MKINVDLDRCEDHGQCVFAAPSVFEFGDDDTLHWTAEAPDTMRGDIEHAATSCPVAAITLSD